MIHGKILDSSEIPVRTLSGTIQFNNTKTAAVQYSINGQQVAFRLAPRVAFTIVGGSSPTPFKTKDVKTGDLFTGLVIGFQNAITATVEWFVLERT